MHRLHLLAIVIGVFCADLTYAQDEFSGDSESPPPGMVWVDPLPVSNFSQEGDFVLKPYSERRDLWASAVSLTYSSFEPLYYSSSFQAVNFVEIYGHPSLPMVELSFSVRRNFEWGGFGGEFSVGAFQSHSMDTTVVDSTLSLNPIRLGATVVFDRLMPDPWVVPYLTGGVYEIFFKESQSGTSFNGNTIVAPYFVGGLAFPLDWLDRHAARVAYYDSGIQGTFVTMDARQQMASHQNHDPDFSSDFTYGAGLRVEF